MSTTGKPPDSGWFWIANDVADRLLELGRLPYVVYTTLARRSNSERVCGWSQRRLAEALGVTERAVRKAIATLSEAGLVDVEQGQSNRYLLSPTPPPTEPEPEFLRGTDVPVNEEPEFRLDRNSGPPIKTSLFKTFLSRQKGTPKNGGGSRKRRKCRFRLNWTRPNSGRPGRNGWTIAGNENSPSRRGPSRPNSRN